jgi:autotransporter-associated beta strand protein
VSASGGGGGSGSISLLQVGVGGFGGGQGGEFPDGGGGGAGLGGAVFVMQGASLTIVGKTTLAGGSAQGGNAGAGGTNGQGFGGGMFLQGSDTIFLSPDKGQTERFFNAIDDEAGVVANGYPPPGGFTPGSYRLIKSGVGTLILSADNAYSGATTVKAGTLIVNGSIEHSATTVKSGTLAGHGTTGNVTVLGGGILSPGPGTAILHAGNVVLHPHAHFVVQLGGGNPGPHGYDQLDVTGAVNLAGAKLDLSLLGAFHGHNGETFEIISNDGVDPVIGHLAGLAEGAHVIAGGKVFSIRYDGGDGNDVVLTEHGKMGTPSAMRSITPAP